MEHLVNWIELPTLDLGRARAFYETVLATELVPMDLGEVKYALFPARNVYNAGALVFGSGYTPSADGAVVYLDGRGDMDGILARVVKAGGRIVMPKTYLGPEAGNVALFLDSEGNRVGLQAAVASDATVEDATMQGLMAMNKPGLAFVVRRGPEYDNSAKQHLQWEHARNMFTLLRRGLLRSVTALLDGTDVLGIGVLNVDNADQARALLAQDPGVMGGRITIDVLTALHFGSETTRV